jgi:hypothetical protein
MADEERERWTKLVSDFEASDLTQREFATERGISFSNLRNWIYRLRKESRPLVEKAPEVPSQARERPPRREHSRLVPVRVVASAAKPRREEAVPATRDALLELVFASGARLRFQAGPDLASHGPSHPLRPIPQCDPRHGCADRQA